MTVLEDFAEVGAVLTGHHFVYKSQKHGPNYINPDGLLPFLPQLGYLGDEMAPADVKPGVVLGPAFGGNYLAFMAAEGFSRRGIEVKWVATVKDDDDFIIEPDRGFEKFVEGQDVWVTEDLATTGGSVKKVCRMVERYGGRVLGVCVAVNRGGVTKEDLGVPRLESVATVSFTAVDREICQLCVDLVPIVEDVGHGDDFKTKYPDYPGGFYKLLS